ncbi:unnamed protein product [Prunus armeniaca]|uniref:Uncharacterized protein n=1 Tax=Prunus armeniaca TaxID=36596 RepID=A0A6J5Y0E9_PRUAR|nr:unnamed protein product [Prunus armeniaca]CAB4319600.1 unnamed protein product [Prunus armeniaca]
MHVIVQLNNVGSTHKSMKGVFCSYEPKAMKQYFPLALVSMLWLSHKWKALIGLDLPSCLRNNWKMEFYCINCSNSSRSFIICGNLLQRSSVTVILKFLGLGSCDLDIVSQGRVSFCGPILTNCSRLKGYHPPQIT